MEEKSYMLITVRRVSAVRRFWRELYALVRWGLTDPIYNYGRCYSVFSAGVLGHEGFSVYGRKNADEVELKFFGDVKGPHKVPWNGSYIFEMQTEMRDAVREVARRYGYDDVFYRERDSSPFYTA